MDTQVAVVMVPLPAQGHLNPLLHFSCLITSYNIPVHYAGYGALNHQAEARLHGWDPKISRKINFHDFQLPSFSTSSPTNPEAALSPYRQFFDLCSQLHQPVSELLQQLSEKFSRIIIIHDELMASVVQDAKFLPNAECYSFHTGSALAKFISIWDLMPEKPFQLDSDVVPVNKLPSFGDYFEPEIISFLEKQQRISDFQCGSLLNTCRVTEGKYVQLLERLPMKSNTKQFAIGPMNPVEMMKNSTIEIERHGCLGWLDKQEKDSVIYVAFGSTTSMSSEQIKELALGLERSDQRFIWVVRNANKGASGEDQEAEKGQLPEGYEERVKGRGMVVSDWAPQLEILAHPSTGGFVSHCGWNSCMESISMGVPIAAWPMHSDQPINTVLVTEVLRIGIVVRDWARRADIMRSTMIEDVVRRLMASNEGVEMRTRAAELGEAVRVTVAKGGASQSEMEAFIAHITR